MANGAKAIHFWLSSLTYPKKCCLKMIATLQRTPTNIIICLLFLNGFSKSISKANTKVSYNN